MDPIVFKYVPVERIWGGNALCEKFHRDVPMNARIGETWDLSDNGKVNSVVASGKYAGATLRRLIKEHCLEIMGPEWNPDAEFPILVKWLDCEKPISVQVHPTARVAEKYADRVKDECWYVASCGDAGKAEAIVGLKDGVSEEDFKRGAHGAAVLDCLQRVSLSEGDGIFLPTGTVHSIVSPALIYEVQQNSDSAYRVYDWDRVGPDGRSRPLHIDKFLETVEFPVENPVPVRGVENGVICKSRHFTESVRTLSAGRGLSFEACVQPRILTVLSGCVSSGGGAALKAFDTVLLPYAGAFEFIAREESKLIITEDFL